nr:TPA_asm: NADH dehydrogenase subunit 4L [Pseudomyrmex ferrugineus]
MFYDYLFMYMFIISLIVLGSSYKYMLIVLLVIELVVFNLSLLLGIYLSALGMEFFMIYYLVFSLCESVLGMSILIMVVRFHGSDMYSSINLSNL